LEKERTKIGLENKVKYRGDTAILSQSIVVVGSDTKLAGLLQAEKKLYVG
jgi:hypothetical protein